MGLCRKFTREHAGVRGRGLAARKFVLRGGVVACGDGLLIFGLVAEAFPERRRRSDRSGRGLWRRFLFFFFAGVTFFIPFFLRAGAPRFAFLDFFATFNLPIGLTKIMQHGTTSQPLILTCAQPPLITCTRDTAAGPLRPNQCQRV